MPKLAPRQRRAPGSRGPARRPPARHRAYRWAEGSARCRAQAPARRNQKVGLARAPALPAAPRHLLAANTARIRTRMGFGCGRGTNSTGPGCGPSLSSFDCRRGVTRRRTTIAESGFREIISGRTGASWRARTPRAAGRCLRGIPGIPNESKEGSDGARWSVELVESPEEAEESVSLSRPADATAGPVSARPIEIAATTVVTRACVVKIASLLLSRTDLGGPSIRVMEKRQEAQRAMTCVVDYLPFGSRLPVIRTSDYRTYWAAEALAQRSKRGETRAATARS